MKKISYQLATIVLFLMSTHLNLKAQWSTSGTPTTTMDQILIGPISSSVPATPNADTWFQSNGTVVFQGFNPSGAVYQKGNPIDPSIVFPGEKLLLWVPSLGSFRAGIPNGSSWDAANTGTHSFAVNQSNTASGTASSALGYYNTASGYGSLVGGGFTQATKSYSFGFGYNTIANGDHSIAFGQNTVNNLVGRNYINCFAWGSGNSATGPAFTTSNTNDYEFLVNAYNGVVLTADQSSSPANTLYVKNTGIGIGTSNPQASLAVQGNRSVFGGNALKGTYSISGDGATEFQATGDNHLQIYSGVSGSNYNSIGFGISPASSYNECGLYAGKGGSNTYVPFVIYNNGYRVYIKTTGEVGIGTTTPNEKLTVAGNITPDVDDVGAIGTSTNRWHELWVTSGMISTSDINKKTKIENLNYGITEIMKLRPVFYHWKKNDDGKRIGLIAQEVESVINEVVVNKEGQYGLRYSELIPVLI